jgi:hypothetical protein
LQIKRGNFIRLKRLNVFEGDPPVEIASGGFDDIDSCEFLFQGTKAQASAEAFNFTTFAERRVVIAQRVVRLV